MKLTLLALFFSSTVFAAAGVVDDDSISKMARQRAILQEQKLRLQEDLFKQNKELKNLKSMVGIDRKEIFQSLSFLNYVKEHSNRIIFQGIQSSSSLDRRQRLLEELTSHQLRLIKEKAKAISTIEKTQRTIESRLALLAVKEQNIADIQDQIDQAYLLRDRLNRKKGSLPSLKGRLDWPVKFEEKQKRFGINTFDDTDLVFRSNGIYLETPENEAVKSIHEGEVIFTGLLDGFGPTVIVDHGDHFYSVYSGLKDLAVQTGEKVANKQKIASAGYVQNLEMYGIYFELRHFKQALDPEPWMKGIAQ